METQAEYNARQARYNRITRRRRRDWINNHKNVPCSRCGGSFPAVCMDFHHRDPAEKLFTISMGIHRSKVTISAEIAKCDVLCANCHRIVDEQFHKFNEGVD